MDAIQDFEDFLELLDRHSVRYLIMGGLAFIYHAKPRFTKDIDIWIGPGLENLARANAALAEFGSPYVLSEADDTEILYMISRPHAPSHSSGVRWNDPLLGIAWPLPESATINERDSSYPDLTRTTH